jgi:hypothetical protein
MAGTSPAMTPNEWFNMTGNRWREGCGSATTRKRNHAGIEMPEDKGETS